MGEANLILYSTAIFDSIQDVPFDGAVAIRGNRIVYVGDRQGAAPYIGENTQICDFRDGMIMPGFYDAHGHYQTAATREFGTCISHLESCRSEEETAAGVAAYLKEHPDCKRVHGRCFFMSNWGRNPKEPTKASLDVVSQEIPIYMLSSSGHSAWLNTAAMKECDLEGLIAQHPEWDSDWVRRDENGEPTGFICENASYTVRYMVEVYDHEDYAKWDRQYMQYLNRLGVTSTTECNCMYPRVQIDIIEPIKRMENEGTLTIRFHQYSGGPIGKNENHAADVALEDLRYLDTYFHTDKIRIAGCKYMLDGTPDTYTGAMLEPYAGRPDTDGGPTLTDPEMFTRMVVKANSMGFPVIVHCMGDRSVKMTVDAYEESYKVNGPMRNRIEHMNQIRPEDIERMAKYGIIASVQPAHIVDWLGESGESIYGEKMYRHDSPYRSLINVGVRIAVGTDSPVVDSNPLRTVYEAITRCRYDDGTPVGANLDEAMTLAEVLKGYTIGAAYSEYFDDKVGTLEAGKLADIAVIDRNLFAGSPEEIRKARNICTVFDGKIIYKMI